MSSTVSTQKTLPASSLAELSSEVEYLKAEITDLQGVATPILAKLEQLRRQLRKSESRAFIAANQITRADVEMSDGPKKPWFGTAWAFGEWLLNNGNPRRRWAEWNGRIYHATDLIGGRVPDMPGCVDDLPHASRPEAADSVPSPLEFDTASSNPKHAGESITR